MNNYLYADYVASKQGLIDAKEAGNITAEQFRVLDYNMRKSLSQGENGRQRFLLSDFLKGLALQVEVMQIEDTPLRLALTKLFESLASGVWVARPMPKKAE